MVRAKRPQVLNWHFRKNLAEIADCSQLPVPCIPSLAAPSGTRVPFELPNLESGEVKVAVSCLTSPFDRQSEACRIIEGEMAESFQDPGRNGDVGLGGRGRWSLANHAELLVQMGGQGGVLVRVPSLSWFRANVELLEDGSSQTVVVAVCCPHRRRGRFQRWGVVSHSSIPQGRQSLRCSLSSQ